MPPSPRPTSTAHTHTYTHTPTPPPTQVSAIPPPLPSQSSLALSTSKLRLLILEPSPSSASTEFCSSSRARYQPSSPSSQAPSLIPSFLQALTGEAPPPQIPSHDGVDGPTGQASLAGYTTHPPLRVRTKYFDTKVGLWCDEVPLPLAQSLSKPGSVRRIEDGDVGDGFSAHQHGDFRVTGPRKEEKEGIREEEVAKPTTQTWVTQMLSLEPEAMEVREVIGAIVLAIPVLDALEANAAASSSSSTAAETDTEPGYGGDGNELPQLPGQSYWKLKPEYLDIIEAVNTLRSTIEDERAGQGGDVGAVVLLQGPIPKPATRPSPRGASKVLPTSTTTTTTTTTTYESDRNSVDALLEAVEDQLLTERAILGWDIIAWDGIPKSPHPPTSIRPRASGKDGSGESAAAAQPAVDDAEETRNLYGEKTGLPRLLELLHNLDWSALPAAPPQTSSPQSPLTSPPAHSSNNKSPSNLDLDLDADLDADLLSSNSDTGSEFQTPLMDSNPRNRDAAAAAFKPPPPQQQQKEEEERGHVEDEDEDEEAEFQVEQLQGLLQQAMAIREAGREMPSAERERYARRMLGRLMGDL